MEMIERYIYSVAKRLPPKQKDDIERELRGLIDDMLQERTGENAPTDKDVEAILLELGEPSAFADKYRDKSRYLIGPDNFDKYIIVLKIVLIATFIGITIALTLNSIINPLGSISETIGNFLSSIISALLSSIVWVTIIFAIFERHGINITKKLMEHNVEWNPNQLPQIPIKQTLIKINEPITGIVFTLIIIIIFNFAPQIMGTFAFSENTIVISIFNIEVLKNYLPLFNIIFCLNILKELLRLLYGKYTIKLATICAVLNAASLIITLVIFSNTQIWNHNFLSELNNIYNFTSEQNLSVHWNTITKSFLALVVVGYLIDIVIFFYKAIKYRLISVK